MPLTILWHVHKKLSNNQSHKRYKKQQALWTDLEGSPGSICGGTPGGRSPVTGTRWCPPGTPSGPRGAAAAGPGPPGWSHTPGAPAGAPWARARASRGWSWLLGWRLAGCREEQNIRTAGIAEFCQCKICRIVASTTITKTTRNVSIGHGCPR